MKDRFLECFFPEIINVHKRTFSFWVERGYEVITRSSKIRKLLYVYSGEGELEIRRDEFPLSAGSMFHISQLGERIRITSSKEQPLLYFTVSYNFKKIKWEDNTLISPEPTDDGLPFASYLQLNNHELLYFTMQSLYDTWSRKYAGYKWKLRLTFMQMINHIDCQLQIEKEEDQTIQLLMRCMDYIHKYYWKPITREMLAGQASMSANHFSSIFKEYTGSTPMQYLMKFRIDEAKRILRSSHIPIMEVAYQVGFKDPLYFTRVFSKEVGFSPREYRNAY